MKINHAGASVKRSGIFFAASFILLFLFSSGVQADAQTDAQSGTQAEGWITGQDAVVYNGIRYVANVDTLELYDVASDQKIDEIKLYDRDEDYKKNPKDYIDEVQEEAESETGQGVGEEADQEADQAVDQEADQADEKVSDLLPENRWERIGYLRIRGNQLVVVTNLGNMYNIEIDSKTVVKESQEDADAEEKAEEQTDQEQMNQENPDKKEKS